MATAFIALSAALNRASIVGDLASTQKVAAPEIQSFSQLPEAFDLGTFSVAGGEWDIDWDKARKDAARTLEGIDFSKSEIVIWVPGTSNHKVHSSFEQAVQQQYGSNASLVAMQYEASWEMRRSVATGLATLLLILEEIKRRGRHVVLAGESQGAWIAGEALAHPALGGVVKRSVIFGHPWLAKHQYLDGHDPRVKVINHEGDQVTLPIKGDPGVGLDAMVAMRTLKLQKLGTVVKAIAANPLHGWLLLKSIAYAIPGLKKMFPNPHIYDMEMSDAVRFLRQTSISQPMAKIALTPSFST